MLGECEFDNMVVKSQLSKQFPNKVDIKFGLDANKVKWVNNFPIYNATDGFRSNTVLCLHSDRQNMMCRMESIH